MRVALVGPASPQDVADLFTGTDRTRAAELFGYRGIPTTELARGLLQGGAEVEIVTVAPEVSETVELTGPCFRMLLAPQRTRARHRALDLFRAERLGLRALLRQTCASVVHALWTYEFAWAALSEPDRPVLVTAHDAPLTVLAHTRDAYRAARTLMAYVVRKHLTNLTVVSPYLASRWRREMLYRSTIAIVPNSVPRLPPPTRSPRTDETRIVDVADGSRRKNVDALIRAVAMLRRSGRDAHLDLVGPGLGQDDPIADAARALRLNESVRFHGVLDRQATADVMGSAAVFAHPSLEESFGLSVVEAMAAGIPVVAGSRSGAIPWVVGSGGLLVNVDQPAAIASAIASLIDDREAARSLGCRGRREATTRFSSFAVAEMYLAQYESLTKTRGSACQV